VASRVATATRLWQWLQIHGSSFFWSPHNYYQSTVLGISRTFAQMVFWPEARTPFFLTKLSMAFEFHREKVYGKNEVN